MKLFVVLACMLLAVTSVAASMYELQVTTNLNSSVVNGQNSMGNILVSKKTIIPETFNISTFTTTSLEVNDVMTWNGNGTIVVSKNSTFIGFLSTGSSMSFGQTGLYTYVLNTDGNQTGTVVVNDVPHPTVNIAMVGGETTNSSISYTLSQTAFTLSTQDIILNVTANVNEDAVTKAYPYTLTTQYSTKNISRTIQTNGSVSIIENRNWNVTENSINGTFRVKSGVTEPIGNIKIQNKGNVDFPVSIELTGEGKDFVQTQLNQTLYRKTSVVFYFVLQIPARTPQKEYNVTAIIRGGEKSQPVLFTVFVTDTDAPTIKRVTFKDDTVYHDNEIVAEVEDNIEVKNVSVSYGNVSVNMTKDQQLWIHKFKPTELTEYSFNVCALDTSGNQICQDVKKTFNRLNIVSYTPVVNMPSKRIGDWSSTALFNLTEKPPESVVISLQEFNKKETVPNTTASFKMRIIDGDGNVVQINNVNESVQVYQQGQIKIEVMSDVEATYDGIIKVTTREFMENVTQNIQFKGKFVNYDVPEAFTINDWYGGKPFSCEVIDSGVVESSYYDCKMQYPITLDVKQFAVPTTPQEKELNDKNFQNTIQIYNERVINRNWAITALVALVLILFVTLLWGAKFHPYWRYRTAGR